MTALAAITETVQIIGLANGVGFFITAAFKTHKITDLFGAGSFVLATLHLSKKSWSTLAASGVLKNNGDLMSSLLTNRLFWINTGVIIWGTRLASYLFHRILYTHEDKRLAKFFPQEGEGFFDKKRSNFPVSLGTFWTIQALWGIICLLPVSMMNSITMFGLKDRDMYSKALDLSTKSISPVLNQVISKLSLEKATSEFVTKTINLPLKWLPVIGIFTGIAIETIADYQKSSYRSKKENDNHWCDKGLWSLSRYPNYFGEILTWWSIYAASLPALLQVTAHPVYRFLPPLVGLLSPSFITYLLFKLSGIPLLEKKQKKAYGDNPEYQGYVRNTPLLVPWPKIFAPVNKKGDKSL